MSLVEIIALNEEGARMAEAYSANRLEFVFSYGGRWSDTSYGKYYRCTMNSSKHLNTILAQL